MMKRLVILQDEQLVFAEIERSARVRAANAVHAPAHMAVPVPEGCRTRRGRHGIGDRRRGTDPLDAGVTGRGDARACRRRAAT